MPVTLESIYGAAPDASALSAARQIKASAWSSLSCEEERGLIWGECQGSGSAPYRATVDTKDLWAKCNCPSRKFPCKHALSLMIAFAERRDGFSSAALPDWVADWVSRRRGVASSPDMQPTRARDQKESTAAEQAGPIAEQVNDAPPDPKTAARAEARRKRLAEQREESVRGGLDELDRWIGDQLERGLASFPQRAPEQCRLLARRLVDAKAPALATRLDALPSELLGLRESERVQFVMETLGLLHLLADAFRRIDKIPELLRHDVRRLIGWTIDRRELLDDATAPRAVSVWNVLAVHSEIQPDRLRRNETRLVSREGQFAVLIDFVPITAVHGGASFMPGEAFQAELVFYPSVAPMRALIAARGEECTFAWPKSEASLDGVLATYDALAARLPWAGARPFLLADKSKLLRINGNLWLCGTTASIPISPRQYDAALSLTATDIACVAVLWDGRNASLLSAQTTLGPWYRSA